MGYELSGLVGVARLRTLTDLWHKATGVPVSATDPDGSILAQSGQQDVCGHFCRINPETERGCSRKDTRAVIKVRAGRKYVVEKCTHGAVHVSTPLAVLGKPVGRFVAGPFFFSPTDMELFTQHAVESGFDESSCIDTVSQAPIVDKTKLNAFLQWFPVLAEILLDAGATKPTVEAGRYARADEITDKSKVEDDIVANVKELILPYVEKLKKSGLSAEQTSAIDIIETNLKEITSPIIRKMQTFGFTAGEIAVASLLKEGRTTKQTAALLGVSARAVEFHRYNIRKKLGLDHRKANLRAHLLTIT
jgi:DNA-binding CsgD family transcriptional regulator/ligand-binding sensor protein